MKGIGAFTQTHDYLRPIKGHIVIKRAGLICFGSLLLKLENQTTTRHEWQTKDCRGEFLFIQIPSCSEHTVFRSVFSCQTIPHATDFSNSICKEKQTWPNVRTIDMISSSLQHSFDKILYTFHPKKLASAKLKRILNLRCKYTLSD